jgi:arsenic resistance protein ArsH
MILDLPNIDPMHLHPVDAALYAAPDDPGHPPRILILHGSARPRSYSRGVGDEA